MSYPYTRSDLLAGAPENYMYSRFEGAGFLAAYEADRKAAVARLDALLGRHGVNRESGDDLAAQLAAWRVDANPRGGQNPEPPAAVAGSVETAEILRSIAAYAVNGGDMARAPAAALLDAFMRKFEVSKRLRRRYDRDLKPADRNGADLAAYAYLAFAVAATAPKGAAGLRHLNLLLKLGDLLSSTDWAAAPPAAISAARAALIRELELLCELAAAKAVAWPDSVDDPGAGLVA